MQRKAFSLLEMSIVLIILALAISVFLPFIKSTLEVKKIEISNNELQTIKKSLIAHIAVKGKLPKADSDGDGIGDTTGLGGIPYIDLNIQPLDKYGMVYKYDPEDSLVSSDESNVCVSLSQIYMESFDINNSTIYPQMVDELNNSERAAAAVIISRGVDKVLTGINNSGNRKYDLGTNLYDEINKNDLVVELNARELTLSMCETGSGDIEPEVRPPFTIVAVGDVYYNTDINPTCIQLLDTQSMSTNAYEIVTFHQSIDFDCSDAVSTGKTVSMTYAELDAMDVNPDDNIINVIKEINAGQPPTMSDN
ncbi:MAG: prepilin-type N-terminal cleavage/methylation domain-containing protein [Arcobacteraceae bacterium]|nr:prepilin-type N-terminal cleavage/methylation domain-containing protein [Arcobacteraceae bacterium]